jgi:hypothetical protein
VLTLSVIATILLSFHALSSLSSIVNAFLDDETPRTGFITSILAIITIWVLYGHIGG